MWTMPWTKPSRTYGNGWLHIGPCPWLVCPKAIAFRADLYFAVVYFLFFRQKISELRWPIAAKFCMLLESVFNFIILFQNFFGGGPPKKYFKKKKHAKFGSILDVQCLVLVSGTIIRLSEDKPATNFCMSFLDKKLYDISKSNIFLNLS